MSADNYARCPVCTAAAPETWPMTLREEYEIGIEPDGEFHCYYQARCPTCGFEWKVEYHAPAYTPPVPPP